MKRARASTNSRSSGGGGSSSSSTDKNDVQVTTTQEEFTCSLPNFSSIFPNIFLQSGGNTNMTPEDKFQLIKDKVWESKKSFKIRSMMMGMGAGETETASSDRSQEDEGMVGNILMKPYLVINMDGGVLLGGVLTISLNNDQIKVFKSVGINRVISLKAGVVDKAGMLLYAPAGIPRQQKPIYNSNNQIRVSFFVAPLKILWENHEFYFPNDLLHVKILLNTRNDALPVVDELTFLPESYKCLLANFLGMFRSGDGADFEIVCKAIKFPVHKAILACRSPVFSRMLSTDMKEKESKSLTVDDVEPRIMKLLLEFLYSSKIELHSLGFEAVLDLGASADKYQILQLRDHCFSYAADRISLKTAGQLAIIVYKHSANEGIRSKVFDYCAANWKELCSQEKFQVLVQACPIAFINKNS